MAGSMGVYTQFRDPDPRIPSPTVSTLPSGVPSDLPVLRVVVPLGVGGCGPRVPYRVLILKNQGEPDCGPGVGGIQGSSNPLYPWTGNPPRALNTIPPIGPPPGGIRVPELELPGLGCSSMGRAVWL